MKKDLIPNIPHRHHYVPQRYLSKWLKEDNQFYVLDMRSNKIKLQGTKSICYETDMYKLVNLTNDEWKIIDSLMNDFPKNLQDRIHEFGNRNIQIETDNEEIKNTINKILIDKKSEFDKINIKIGELLLTDIENVISNDNWEKLYNSDLSFLKTKQDELDFYSYLFTQVYRTSKIKNIIKNLTDELNVKMNISASTEDLFPYIIVIFSIRMSNNIVANNNHKICFLQCNNETTSKLITSDNPIINLLDTKSELPNDYVLYWPLTPTLALLLTNKNYTTNQILDESDILKYNKRIKDNADKYLISNDKKTLEYFLSKQS